MKDTIAKCRCKVCGWRWLVVNVSASYRPSKCIVRHCIGIIPSQNMAERVYD